MKFEEQAFPDDRTRRLKWEIQLMRLKRQTEITIETHSLTVIKTRYVKSVSVYCRSCQETVTAFAPAQAALIFRVHEQFLEQLFESNQIHQADEDTLCSNSLVNYFK